MDMGIASRRHFLSRSLALSLAARSAAPALLGAANPQERRGANADAGEGSKTELFLDDEMLAMTASITRQIHRPTKHRLNPVLRPDQWWETDCAMPLAAMYDPEDKLFKIWYRTGPIVRGGEFIDGHSSYSGYATSTDGVHWQKPHLGAVELAGRKDHNVVLLSDGVDPRFARQGKKAFIWSVVRHPHPRDESEKFVCLYFDMKKLGAYLGYSPDGIHWRKEPEPFWQTICDLAGWGDDSLMSLIYDRRKGRWVVYRRVNPQESERLVAEPGDEKFPRPDRGMRIMAYADSPDLKRWEHHQIILTPDADDPADVEFYGLDCQQYAQVYAGYLWVFHQKRADIDAQLVTSRDGIHFTRCCRRETFVLNGPPDYYDHELAVCHHPEPIILNDVVYLFYAADNYKHTNEDENRLYSKSAGGLCTFTRDRFVSLQTGMPPPCRVVTKPFVLQHPKLFLNGATWGGGAIHVEILTRDWRTIEGFTANDAIMIKGNALNHPARWKENADLGRLAGKEIRLKFNMTDARLHALYFDMRDRPLKELPSLAPTGSGHAELPQEV